MSDDGERLDRLEEAVAKAGEPQDEPHQEMAQAVAEATVEAGAEATAAHQRRALAQMRGMIRDVKWMLVAAVLLVGAFVVLFR